MNAIQSGINRTVAKNIKADYAIIWTEPKEITAEPRKYRMLADRALLDSGTRRALESVDIDTREVLAFLPEKYAPYLVELIGLAFTLADYREKTLKECVISILYQMKKYRTRMSSRPTLADSFTFARDYVETRSQYGYNGKVTTASRKGQREYRAFVDLESIEDIIGSDDARTIRDTMRVSAIQTVAKWRSSLDSGTLARVEKFLGIDTRKVSTSINVDKITGEVSNYDAKNRKSAERIARLARMTVSEFENVSTIEIIKTIALFW